MLDELFFRINTSVETIVNVGIATATAITLKVWKNVSKGDSVKMKSVSKPHKDSIKAKILISLLIILRRWKRCFLDSFCVSLVVV